MGTAINTCREGRGSLTVGYMLWEDLLNSLECLPGQIQFHRQVEVQSTLEEIAKQVLPGSVSALLCPHHTAPPRAPASLPGHWTTSPQLQQMKGDPSKMQAQLPGLLESHSADKFDFVSVLNPR